MHADAEDQRAILPLPLSLSLSYIVIITVFLALIRPWLRLTLSLSLTLAPSSFSALLSADGVCDAVPTSAALFLFM